MDFGQLPPSRSFDTRRAPLRFAGRGATEVDFSLHLGAPQWTNPEWVGKIYPKGTKSSEYLSHYSRQWNAIELNTSFYNIPTLDQIAKWAATTPPEFRFYVKVFQDISHEADAWADLRILRARIHHFVQTWSTLESRLGGCFLQLPPEFSTVRFEALSQALSLWPREVPLAVEFRHASWFTDRALIETARELLVRRGIGTVITDTPGRRDASHGTLTNDRLFVRFLGQSTIDQSSPLPADLERITAWADAVARSRAAGLRDHAFFIHTPENFWVPELTATFLARLRERGTDPRLSPPRIVEETQLRLF